MSNSVAAALANDDEAKVAAFFDSIARYKRENGGSMCDGVAAALANNDEALVEAFFDRAAELSQLCRSPGEQQLQIRNSVASALAKQDDTPHWLIRGAQCPFERVERIALVLAPLPRHVLLGEDSERPCNRAVGRADVLRIILYEAQAGSQIREGLGFCQRLDGSDLCLLGPPPIGVLV